MLLKIKINDFRALKDKEIYFGNYITAISGLNGTGKTNLLGLIGNSCELKKKDALPILKKQFRADFSELFEGSEQFDISKSERYIIYFSDVEGQSEYPICFRSSWQKKNSKSENELCKKRFRLIPRRMHNGDKTESKLEYPILYLGLSRLFPSGETNHEEIEHTKIKLSENEKEKFDNYYKTILNLQDVKINNVENLDFKEKGSNKGVGIITDDYDSSSNSAGQDNVGQILLALLSFQRLKENNHSYNGGILLIDEFDATLHPHAQQKLIEILIKEAKENKVQIIFTTHSLFALDLLCKKTEHNRIDSTNNDIEISYFHRTSNKVITIRRNPSFSAIKNNLIQNAIKINKKVDVFCEDDEARQIAKKLLDENKFNLIPISIGCAELIQLRKLKIPYFKQVLIVVDGDVNSNKINNAYDSEQKPIKNILKLPGETAIESEIYNFLISIPDTDPLWFTDSNLDSNFNLSYLKNNHPIYTDNSDKKDREKWKEWFKKHQQLFDDNNILDLWMDKNRNKCNEFISQADNLYKELIF